MYSGRSLLLLLLFLLGTVALTAQDFPYALDWRKEVTLFSVGLGAGALGYTLESQLEGLSQEEVLAQNRSDVWGFDRGATHHESEAHRTLSDDLLRGAMLMPATLAVSKRGRRRVLVLATLLAETMLLNEGLTKVTKVVVRRSRPLTYNLDYDPDSKLGHDARQSFVSGHTSNAAALSFFTAKVLHDLYPNSGWRPLIWAGAATVPLLTGYARYRAGKHFPTDIIAGYALGATLGILIPQWHKSTTGSGLSLGPAGDGLGLTLRW